MPYEIIKNYPADFPALTYPEPNAEVLEAQIDTAIASAECEGIIVNPGMFTLQFDVQPSPTDLTAIDNVCNAHTGAPFVRTPQQVFAEAVQTETGTSFLQKASLASGLLAGGDYLISWYSEISVTSTGTTQGAEARVLWNGTERASSSGNRTLYESFGGSVVVTVAQLTAPVLSIELRRVGSSTTAQIRRIRLSISPLGGV